MVKKKIIAHFMHEYEEGVALNKLKDIEERTEGYILGFVEEDDIQDLENQGIIVQYIEELPKAEPPGGDFEPIPGIKIHQIRSKEKIRDIIPDFIPDLSKPNYYLIQLKGPLIEKWRAELKGLGVVLLEYIPTNYYKAKLSLDQVNQIKILSFVGDVRIYGPEDTGPIIKKLRSPLKKVTDMVVYDILVHQVDDLDIVKNWFEDNEINIAGASGKKIRFYLPDNSMLLRKIAQLTEVALGPVEYIQPKLHNNKARLILGIDKVVNNNLSTTISFMGKDQTVAVADTGIDKDHPDFEGRIKAAIPWGRPTMTDDPHGHGTHVSGSILGSGKASQKKIRGIAPKATLFFQSLLDNEGGIGGLPLNLNELFQEAYDNNARIHNNSWGAATDSMYTIDSLEVDEFVASHRDFLVVFSAGNEGQASNRLHSEIGYADWLSIGSPASSKNAITVGASRNSRDNGGYSQFTYGFVWPYDFPDPPIANEKISGDVECLAGFSSRGPCDDRRIKPDVVVPGTDIASTKSSCAPLRNFWGPYPNNNFYAFMGGTSMAAPIISGFAAIVREYFEKKSNHKPSAALLKATLINSTRWLSGSDAIKDHNKLPNFHQGFGCIQMQYAIPNSINQKFKIEFEDPWKTPNKQFNHSGQKYRYYFSISGGKWLRVCLVWTDPPGRALQNNLNLFVQQAPNGKKWIGNENLPMKLTHLDRDNNVEVVRIENPPIGDYYIQITATNLLQVPQDYALVVAGELSSGLTEF